MYHDQVFAPLNRYMNLMLSNITLGIPFLRISVDHGPNEIMLEKSNQTQTL